jgi:hypothetical protein
VPRVRQYDRRLAVGCELLELAGQSERIEEQQPLSSSIAYDETSGPHGSPALHCRCGASQCHRPGRNSRMPTGDRPSCSIPKRSWPAVTVGRQAELRASRPETHLGSRGSRSRGLLPLPARRLDRRPHQSPEPVRASEQEATCVRAGGGRPVRRTGTTLPARQQALGRNTCERCRLFHILRVLRRRIHAQAKRAGPGCSTDHVDDSDTALACPASRPLTLRLSHMRLSMRTEPPDRMARDTGVSS